MGLETGAIIALAGLGASLTATGATVYQGREAARDAKDQARDQRAEQHRLRSELEEKERLSEAQKAAAEQRRRQRAALAGQQSENTHTSPGGIPSVGSYPRRTLLGG